MSTRSAQIAGTANVPARLDFAADSDYRDGFGIEVRVVNAEWYVGAADVTTSNGWLIHADEPWSDNVTSGDPVWAVSATGCTYYVKLKGV